MSDTERDTVDFNAFGVKGSVRGMLTVSLLMVAIAVAAVLYVGWRLEHTLELTETRWQQHFQEMSAQSHDEHLEVRTTLNQRSTEHQEIIAALRQVKCLAWYTESERKAIRERIEAHPALKDLWCP